MGLWLLLLNIWGEICCIWGMVIRKNRHPQQEASLRQLVNRDVSETLPPSAALAFSSVWATAPPSLAHCRSCWCMQCLFSELQAMLLSFILWSTLGLCCSFAMFSVQALCSLGAWGLGSPFRIGKWHSCRGASSWACTETDFLESFQV